MSRTLASPPTTVQDVDAQEESRGYLLPAIQGWRLRREEGYDAKAARRDRGAQLARDADHEVTQIPGLCS